MSFNEKIPLEIHDLKNRIKTNNLRIRQAWQEVHECDCEFCEFESDPDDFEEAQKAQDDLNDENKLIEKTIQLLIKYADDHNVELLENLREENNGSKN